MEVTIVTLDIVCVLVTSKGMGVLGGGGAGGIKEGSGVASMFVATGTTALAVSLDIAGTWSAENNVLKKVHLLLRWSRVLGWVKWASFYEYCIHIVSVFYCWVYYFS